MKVISRVGVDLSKSVFYVYGVDKSGNVQLSKSFKRQQFLHFISKLNCCEIVFEACSSSHYWARKVTSFGLQAKLINPAYVKPYVKTNKSDARDAEAICEAASRPNMRFVPVKSITQHDLQALHRIRERLVTQGTALSNQIRGILSEYGLVTRTGIPKLKVFIPAVLEDAENELTSLSRMMISDLYDELTLLETRVQCVSRDIQKIAASSDQCQLLISVPGIGPIISIAIIASIGDGTGFNNGRAFAVWLGVVPRQHSTGGKTKLLGISKHGNTYLRKILIQGAHSFLLRAKSKDDSFSKWAIRLKKQKGSLITSVAIANKLARITWAVLTTQTMYQAK